VREAGIKEPPKSKEKISRGIANPSVSKKADADREKKKACPPRPKLQGRKEKGGCISTQRGRKHQQKSVGWPKK